jgi:hypothetical protein
MRKGRPKKEKKKYRSPPISRVGPKKGPRSTGKGREVTWMQSPEINSEFWR